MLPRLKKMKLLDHRFMQQRAGLFQRVSSLKYPGSRERPTGTMLRRTDFHLEASGIRIEK